MKDTIVGRSYLAIVALAAWLGLTIQFYVTQTHPNLADISPIGRTVRFLEYFTILTNLMVAITSTVSLIAPSTGIGRFFSRPGVRTAVAVYIALVGLVYNVILQGLNEFTGAAWIADFLTHDAVPVLYVIYWLLFVPKGELTWRMPFAWIVYPLVYVPFVLVRATTTGRYPYPFLDVGQLGLSAVLFNTLLLTFVFLFLGLVFVMADRVIARFFPGRRSTS